VIVDSHHEALAVVWSPSVLSTCCAQLDGDYHNRLKFCLLDNAHSELNSTTFIPTFYHTSIDSNSQRSLDLVQPRHLVDDPLPLLLVGIPRVRPPAVGARLRVSPLVSDHILGAVDAALSKAPLGDGQLDLQSRGLLVLPRLPEVEHVYACLGLLALMVR
jgi:hypothetical protein